MRRLFKKKLVVKILMSSACQWDEYFAQICTDLFEEERDPIRARDLYSAES